MRLRHRVSLDGVQLDSVDSRILIQSVTENPGKDNVSMTPVSGGNGSRITSRHRDYLDIQINFAIRATYREMNVREEILEAVNAWANVTGWLKLSYRSNRRIYVRPYALPGAGDPANWTGEYTITLRASDVPYWEETTASGTCATKKAAKTGSATLAVGGNTTTQADVTLLNGSGATINTASVTVGSRTISFTSLGLEADESLVIDHNYAANGILRARIKNTAGKYRSVLSKRSEASDDDFRVNPGNVTVSYTAQRGCTLTASARGRFI